MLKKLIFASVLLLSGCGSTSDVKPAKAAKNEGLTTALTLSSGGELKAVQSRYTIAHADLYFDIFPEKEFISAATTLSLNLLADTQQIELDFDRRYTIDEIRLNQQTLPALSYANPQGILTINSDKVLRAGDKVKVSIRYQGQPYTAKNAPWDGGFVWSKTPSGEPWIATAIQGEGCDLLWPCIDHPSAEPEQIDIKIAVPKPLVAASNGKLMGVSALGDKQLYHWHSALAQNNYAISLNIGPFNLLRDQYLSRFGNKIDLNYYHLPGQESKAQSLFAEFSPMLDFFEHVIGPYPFAQDKMGVVDTPHLGMEHQSINAYGNNYKIDAYGFDWLLQHEFAHEWFGNQMTNHDWNHMWLHEAFATYMQPLYVQYQFGDMAYMAYMYKIRQSVANKHPIVAKSNLTGDEVYQGDVGPGLDIYYKGAHVLHTLRHLVGDDAFYTATRKLVYGLSDPKPGQFKPRLATTDEFIQYVNEATGRDLQWFFDIYLFQSALPDLKVTKHQHYMEFEWVTPDGLPFPMPLEISLNGETRKLTMTDIYSLLVNDDDVVIIDPHAKILRHQPQIERFRDAITTNN